jgi:alkyl hydroperoxide reductase subunit D
MASDLPRSPEYAKELKLNFRRIVKTTELAEEQLWGALVATAAATKSERLLREVAEDALDVLSQEAYDAALGAAAIMGMNNVFYRAKGHSTGPMTICVRTYG